MAERLLVAVSGVAGRMGQALARLSLEEEGVKLAGACEREGHDWTGLDLGEAMSLGRSLGVKVSESPGKACDGVDALLDFTTPQASVAAAGESAKLGVVHVIGTTGLDDAQKEQLAEAGRETVIVQSGNMSLGVNLLAGLVRRVAAALDDDWDAEIVEMHHRRKVDAPSGTALLLGEAVAAGRGVDLEDCADRGRDGHTGQRKAGRIGFAALRGGDVVGEHEVVFAGMGERVALRHVATDRGIYARGALRAARWGQKRDPGLYDMEDVLGLRE